jgi:hypothetical protein
VLFNNAQVARDLGYFLAGPVVPVIATIVPVFSAVTYLAGASSARAMRGRRQGREMAAVQKFDHVGRAEFKESPSSFIRRESESKPLTHAMHV